MVACAIIALGVKGLRDIIVFSAASSAGYIILLFSRGFDWEIILKFLIFDGINKIAVLLIVSNLEEGEVICGADDRYDSASSMFFILSGLNLICSVGLPISGMFFVKLSILESFINIGLWLDVVSVLVASSVAFLYHYKLVRKIFFGKGRAVSLFSPLPLAAITVVQLVLPWVIL